RCDVGRRPGTRAPLDAGRLRLESPESASRAFQGRSVSYNVAANEATEDKGMATEHMKARTEAKNGQQTRDWATDYDIFDPDYVRDPYPVWDELREKCPVAHTEHWGSSWMPTPTTISSRSRKTSRTSPRAKS